MVELLVPNQVTRVRFSVAIRRPVFLLLVRGSSKAAGGDAPIRVAADPKTGRKLRLLTLVVGIACLADAALQTVLAITLSTGAFLVAKTAIRMVALLAILSGALLYVRSRQ